MSETDSANSLNSSNFLVRYNTSLYSPVRSQSCFGKYLSKKNLNWVLRFLKVRSSVFTLKILL